MKFITILFAVLILLTSCGKKEAIVERAEKPLFEYKEFEHGLNPKSITLKIYKDGYVVIFSKDEFSGAEKKKAEYLPGSDVEGLLNLFIEGDFLNVKPLSLPAIYGGILISITFNHEGKSNTIKFLKGTKIPFSVERCWDGLDKITSPFFK